MRGKNNQKNHIRNHRKNHRKNGFTLVELIVVLVILAILAALLVPALTGYIDNAKKKAAVAECRQIVIASQTFLIECYGAEADSTIPDLSSKPAGAFYGLSRSISDAGVASTSVASTDTAYDEIYKNAEVSGEILEIYQSDAKVAFVKYQASNGYIVIYDLNYKANNREALYTFEDGEPTETPDAGGGGEENPDSPEDLTKEQAQEKASASLEEVFANLFASAELTTPKNDAYQVLPLAGTNETYYLVYYKTSSGNVKNEIKDAYGVKESVIIEGKEGNSINESDLRKLDDYLKKTVGADYGTLDKVTIKNGKLDSYSFK